MTRFLARQLSTTHWFNIDAARRDLGYQPLVSIAEGLLPAESLAFDDRSSARQRALWVIFSWPRAWATIP